MEQDKGAKKASRGRCKAKTQLGTTHPGMRVILCKRPWDICRVADNSAWVVLGWGKESGGKIRRNCKR